jgi:hypothetical protein
MGPCFDSLWNCFLGAPTTQDGFVSLQVVLVILLCMLLMTNFCMGAMHLPKGIYKAQEPKGAWK